MTKKLIIIGMGGHSKVVASVARRNNYCIQGFLDDKEELKSHPDYLGKIDKFEKWIETNLFFIAIGNNNTRSTIAARLKDFNLKFPILIDPAAIVGSDVHICPGTLVMPGAVINVDSKLGRHVIINTSATVDHDCVIEDNVHISPGVHLAGNVHVGRSTHIGIGANVIPYITIGANSIVGAGSTVIKDIPSNTVVAGVPAKVIKTRSNSQPES